MNYEKPMEDRSQFWFFLAAIFFSTVIAHAQVSPDGDRVLQFLVDPLNPDQAWMLTHDNLQLNDGLKTGGKWQIRFNRDIFKKVTDRNLNERYRHRKIQSSKSKPGALYLLVENGDEVF